MSFNASYTYPIPLFLCLQGVQLGCTGQAAHRLVHVKMVPPAAQRTERVLVPLVSLGRVASHVGPTNWGVCLVLVNLFGTAV